MAVQQRIRNMLFDQQAPVSTMTWAFDMLTDDFETEDGWWLVRASNTQAALSARAEANSPEALTKVLHAMHTALAANGITPKK